MSKVLVLGFPAMGNARELTTRLESGAVRPSRLVGITVADYSATGADLWKYDLGKTPPVDRVDIEAGVDLVTRLMKRYARDHVRAWDDDQFDQILRRTKLDRVMMRNRPRSSTAMPLMLLKLDGPTAKVSADISRIIAGLDDAGTVVVGGIDLGDSPDKASDELVGDGHDSGVSTDQLDKAVLTYDPSSGSLRPSAEAAPYFGIRLKPQGHRIKIEPTDPTHWSHVDTTDPTHWADVDTGSRAVLGDGGGGEGPERDDPGPPESGARLHPRDEAPATRSRYIQGRCDKRLALGRPSWLLVRVGLHPPERGDSAATVNLPRDGTTVHAMLQTTRGIKVLSERDIEIVVPGGRDSGWHGWQIAATISGDHRAVACFHHHGEVLAALTFDLKGGTTANGELIGETTDIDLQPLEVRQGLLIVRREGRVLSFVGIDGGRRGEGLVAVGQTTLSAVQARALDSQRKALNKLAPSLRRGRAAEVDAVRDMGIDLFHVVPPEIQSFLRDGAERWQSLKIESDEVDIAWELLADRDGTTDAFLALRTPFLRWRLGLPAPAGRFTRGRAVLVPGVALEGAAIDTAGDAAIDAVRTQLGLENDTIVTSSRGFRKALENGDFDLLHYAGHMTTSGAGDAVMHIGNDEVNIGAVRALRDGALTRRPLVFLNACWSDRKQQRIEGLVGWGDEFLRAGAGAFVGTSWSVRRTTAEAFAEHFYDALTGGAPGRNLAETTALARQAIATEVNAWEALAYTVYGHPCAIAA